MLAKTHLAFGFLSALIMIPIINPSDKIIFTSIILLGALLPDIDQPNSKISSKIPIIPHILNIFVKHRGIFHSAFFAVLLPYAFGYFVGFNYGLALFIGYASHLLIDGFTEQGINFLHPFAKLHMSGFIQTGTVSELVVFIGLLACIIIKLI